MRRGGGISILGVIYLIIGVIVAGNQGYFVDWTNPGNIIEGLLAVLLWPALLFGVDLHGLVP
ncbi:MAG: hypothetical protein M3116_02205 [Actinomycetota bacterium]|nr:hypothetical protein [Actinomycetota bacterium]